MTGRETLSLVGINLSLPGFAYLLHLSGYASTRELSVILPAALAAADGAFFLGRWRRSRRPRLSGEGAHGGPPPRVRPLRRYLLLACALGLLSIPAWSWLVGRRDTEIAGRAVARLHRLANAGGYGSIYTATAPIYRKAISEERSRELFALLRQRVGLFAESREVGAKARKFHGRWMVRLRYQTRCTDGVVDEDFIWYVSGGRALLVRYLVWVTHGPPGGASG